MVANWNIQRPIFLNVANEVTRTMNEKGEVFLTGGITPALMGHFVLVSLAYIIGFAALILGLLTFRAKPVFPYQALVHKHIGRVWVWVMMISGFQAAFVVEHGTPAFVVAVGSVMYTTLAIGVHIIRTRGDFRDLWAAEAKDSITKDEKEQQRREKILKGLKIAHAVFIGISYFCLFMTGVFRYPGIRQRNGGLPYKTNQCFLDPKGCYATQLCFPSYMNTLSPELNATAITYSTPWANSMTQN